MDLGLGAHCVVVDTTLLTLINPFVSAVLFLHLGTDLTPAHCCWGGSELPYLRVTEFSPHRCLDAGRSPRIQSQRQSTFLHNAAGASVVYPSQVPLCKSHVCNAAQFGAVRAVGLCLSQVRNWSFRNPNLTPRKII